MTFDEVFTGKRRWAYQCGTIFEQIKLIPDNSIHCIVTSPPYFNLRDYNVAGQLGLEPTLSEYLANQVAVFDECRRALHPSGILFLNMGDSYAASSKSRTSDHTKNSTLQGAKATQAFCQPNKLVEGFKPKDLMGVPWRLAIALQDAGWYLRSDIIWSKTNAMPESIRDRPSKAHEYIFMLTKSRKYFYDIDAERTPQKSIGQRHEGKSGYREGHDSKRGGFKTMTRSLHPDGSGLRSVWTVSVGRYKHAHFATFPKKLIVPCIRVGSSAKGVCPSCLEPWKRTVKTIRVATRPGTNAKAPTGWDTGKGAHGNFHKDGRRQKELEVGNRDSQRHCTQRIPTGWKPGCQCGFEETIPATVFDPYLGSGTTMQVAIEEGRRCIGVELNPKYCKLIDRRMETTTTNLFAGV